MGPEFFIYGSDADRHQPHDNARCHRRVEALGRGRKPGRRGLRHELDGAKMRRPEGEAVKHLHQEKHGQRRAQRRDRPAQNGGGAPDIDACLNAWAEGAESELLGRHDLLDDAMPTGLVGEPKLAKVSLLRAHRAEHGELGTLLVRDRVLGPADQHVRRQTDGAQFLDLMLGRLGIQLSARLQIRQQRQMHEHTLPRRAIKGELPDRLEERQAFDVTDGAADFTQHEVDFILTN